MLLPTAKIITHTDDRRMNDYGALVEWYRQGKNQTTRRKTCPSAILS